jgi:hypothetical protein
MLAQMMRYCVFVAFIIVLAACGVRVEIVTPPAPTPTPRDWYGLNYWELDSIWRVQATPHLTFTDSAQANVELFMQPQNDVVMMQYRVLWLVIEYNVTWLAASQSNAQIRLSVYTRAGQDDAWQAYDSTGSTLTTDTIPSTRRDTMVVAFYPEAPGKLEVRAEVGIVAYLENGEIVNQVSANEISVQVLSDPGEISLDVSALVPADGSANPELLLLDWRGWWYGPCPMLDWIGDDASYDPVAAACEHYNNGDFASTVSTLAQAIDTTENPYILATLTSMAGLGEAAQGNFEQAVSLLTRAAALFVEIDQFWQMTICLHNLATVHLMHQDEGAAYDAVYRLSEMRGLFYDEAGLMLTQANIAYLSYDAGSLSEANDYFASLELPQAAITATWLAIVNGE